MEKLLIDLVLFNWQNCQNWWLGSIRNCHHADLNSFGVTCLEQIEWKKSPLIKNEMAHYPELHSKRLEVFTLTWWNPHLAVVYFRRRVRPEIIIYTIILGRLFSKPVSFIFRKKITLKFELYNFVPMMRSYKHLLLVVR